MEMVYYENVDKMVYFEDVNNDKAVLCYSTYAISERCDLVYPIYLDENN